MKKTIIAISLLGLSTGAYATKARLLALGQNKDDPFYVQDSRSIFLNAAQINNYADSITFEWGGTGSPYVTNASPTQNSGGGFDVDSFPKAMGGFLKRSGSWVYGAHIGNESDTGVLLRAAASDTDYADNTTLALSEQLPDADNVLDVFFGSDTGSLKWGANVLYATGKSEGTAPAATDFKSDNIAARVGVLADNWEAYVNASLKGEAERSGTTNKAKFKGKLGLHVGGAYNMGANKLVGSYKTIGWDQTFGATPVTTEGKYSEIHVGWGHTKAVSADTNVYTQLSYVITKVEVKYITDPAELTHTVLPLTVGFETKANEWLAWRGSVSTNITGTVKDKGIGSHFSPAFRLLAAGKFGASTTSTTVDLKKTIANSTKVAGGASLTFGKLTVDGMVGAGTAGKLRLDELLTRVSMSYWF